MDTKLLEDILVLLEERSLTAAAQRRNVTQPAFSRRIRSLEHWIGRDILVRGPNKIDISPTIASCEPEIRAFLGQQKQLRELLRDREDSVDSLNVATQHSLSVSSMSEIIKAANYDNPRWRVRLRTLNQDDAMSMFLRHEADVLVAYDYRAMPVAPFDGSVIRYVWKRDAFLPVVGGELRQLLSEDLCISSDVPCIRYPRGSLFGQIVSHHERSSTRRLDGPANLESTFSIGVTQMVLSGIGAAWVPHSLIQEQVISGDVTILSREYGRIPMDISTYVHQSNPSAIQFQQTLAKSNKEQ